MSLSSFFGAQEMPSLEQSLAMAGQPLQLISLLGAVFILSAYAAQVAGKLSGDQPLHGLLNMIGAGLLLVTATIQMQLGFILLEGVWVFVSGIGLMKALRGKARRK